ncbi:MAG TPA: 2-phospho-L-lactate guanylyltransferase [Candidatus Saccharimonadales bacterium]|jgi:2-phospho-L-lactate guanylyltransferase|nr:2-phospho-L-lactate guanylyltransferase [Candidatus Saccharimonadales bacterium]
MRALLLPIKDLRQAKQRLAPLLNPEERFALAQAMLADTIRAVRGVRRADKVFVVTNYLPAMQAAEENGWELLREDQQISESVSVDAASRQCAVREVTSLLRLPLDVPLVQSSDIDELLATECVAPALVIVPSRDSTGTNAILRTPPALFPSHFGTGSFAKHCAEAQRAGAQIVIRRNRRLEMDVDDEADLRTIAGEDLSRTETGAWLQRSGWLERLKPELKLAANI